MKQKTNAVVRRIIKNRPNEKRTRRNKKYTENELLEGMTPYNAHADLISTTKHKWDDFFDSEEYVSDDFMNDRNQSQDEIRQYQVPISRFKREFNSWFERIKLGNIIVIITRKGKAVFVVGRQLS